LYSCKMNFPSAPPPSSRTPRDDMYSGVGVICFTPTSPSQPFLLSDALPRVLHLQSKMLSCTGDWVKRFWLAFLNEKPGWKCNAESFRSTISFFKDVAIQTDENLTRYF
jgi:hypothetical protein